MADTITLKREIDTLKKNIEIASREKSRLNGRVAEARTKLTAYKRDYEKIQAEFDTYTTELQKIDTQLAKDSSTILEMERTFKKLADEMRRTMISAANSSGAPQKRTGTY